ncbi:hypothetical protein [Cellulosimicrobium marinum]|uniref:hypothetical protein n=1 Tax=Cellulosimicrobium marinum TaxID=1638992 RepID=UPI001E46B2AD|nr:hypothetical protein [Cellulosimicrobium marinum]MCB7137976.1 hypothetical protein [Cellulosimicrobium marinum]
MASGTTDEPSPRPYRPIRQNSPLGWLLRALSRPSAGQFDRALGADPRSDQRLGLLRKASSSARTVLVSVAAVGVFVAFFRGGRIEDVDGWTDGDMLFASVVLRATLTSVALLLPLAVILRSRQRAAERDHDAWLRGSRTRKASPFVPDPRSQPRHRDLVVSCAVCAVCAVPVWSLFW